MGALFKILFGASIVIVSLAFPLVLEVIFGFPNSPNATPDGFLMGLLHGAALPWNAALAIISDITPYSTTNTGWPYDLGFFLVMVGGIGAARG